MADVRAFALEHFVQTKSTIEEVAVIEVQHNMATSPSS